MVDKSSRNSDNIKKQTEVNNQDMGSDLSPMSDAEDIDPAEDLKIDYDQLHPYLKELYDEHIELTTINKKLKSVVQSISSSHVLNNDSKTELIDFLDFFNDEFVPHNKKEEHYFFPLIHQKLLDTHEHSDAANPITGINILEDDHVHGIRLGAILSNLLNLFDAIIDDKSRVILTNQIGIHASELADLIELHIFREDNIILGLGSKLLTKEELDFIYSKTKE